MTYINSIGDYFKYKETLQKVFMKSKKGNIEIPCMNTVLIKRELVVPNHWNPNYVHKDKMAELEDSILISGFCFPSVVFYNDEIEKFMIADGAHRFKMCSEEWLSMEHVPCVIREYDENMRMIATVQFNKARGVHQVDLDADIIRSLIQQGMSEMDICNHLKIDIETVMRYKSLTGIAELFKNQLYSTSWSMIQKEEE
jgi:ParB-like chromosome segregation protein Spo0J